MGMPVRAVLFDLDNTLYPASNQLMELLDQRIVAHVARFLQLEPEAAHAVRMRYFREHGTTLRGLQLHHKIDSEAYLADVHNLPFAELVQPDPELGPLLQQIRATRAIFTNAPSEHAHAILEVLGISELFTAMFDIRFQEFRPKPDPHGYQRALVQLGVTGTETIMVEDTLRNLETARALGMTTIFIGAAPQHPHAADYVVPDIHAAIGIIHAIQ